MYGTQLRAVSADAGQGGVHDQQSIGRARGSADVNVATEDSVLPPAAALARKVNVVSSLETVKHSMN